jgi:HPt (histidine-containing phosphotransfer) domain-containing protein/ATP-dependent Clp protease adapter protein ClpS
MKNSLSTLLGKYRGLVLAIGLFLAIDAGVALVNIQASRQIEADTHQVNAAGLLRTHAQQLTKGLLTLERDRAAGNLMQSSLAEIAQARLGFNDAAQSLQNGLGEAARRSLPIGDSELREAAGEALAQVVQTWGPIDREVEPLVGNAELDDEALSIAVQKAVTRNNRLTQQADALAGAIEAMARDKAASIRQVQAAAVGLAFLNFVAIVLVFIGRLSRSDRETTAAREETGRILGSVREGLFLLSQDGTVARQRSASLDALLGARLQPGSRFDAFLAQSLPAETVETARDYIDLLFNQRMKEGLLRQLNPLSEAALLSASGLSASHLSFQFDQIREDGKVVALLVSVSDISQTIRLTAELAGAEARAAHEVSLLLGVLEHDPRTVSAFLERACESLQTVNDELQAFQPGMASSSPLVNRIARIVHGLKGEAGALGCASLAQATHLFEDVLSPLRHRPGLSGEDLIPVAVGLNDLLAEVRKIEAVIERVRRFTEQAPPLDGLVDNPLAAALKRIEQFASKVAHDLDKAVRLETRLEGVTSLPDHLQEAVDLALPQLVRNAIAHGIELPAERLRQGKPGIGLVRVEIKHKAGGKLVISVHDDGRGLTPAAVREVIRTRDLLPAETVEAMSDHQVVAQIFSPGFTSLTAANEHAGRGDGLAVVREVVHRLDGRLKIKSVPHSHTRFILQFEAA